MHLEHRNMDEHAHQMIPSCSLLDLPPAILEGIATTLVGADKINFMAACREAARVTMLTAVASLKITKHTNFEGIRKVLDSFLAPTHLEVICPCGQEEIITDTRPVPALAVFMDMAPSSYKIQSAPTCCWKAITKITIQADSMRCLVPQFLVLACPQLTQLSLTQKPVSDAQLAFTSDAAKAIPLTPCSSLRQLQLLFTEEPETDSGYIADGRVTVQLPPAYHTIADLRSNLPNIDTLVMTVPNVDLIQTFATQLTRLDIGLLSRGIIEPIRCCLRLQHLSTRRSVRKQDEAELLQTVIPDNPAVLRTLEANHACCSGDDIQQLLQLPSLTKLELAGFMYSHNDWSGHACHWKDLHINHVWHFTSLGRLSLSSLKRLSIGGPDVVISLPDPSDSDSLATVQRAVDNLASIGKIVHKETITDASGFLEGHPIIHWDISDSDHEQEAAQLLAIAAQRVAPVKMCYCENLLHRPLLLRAVFNWGHTFIETAYIGKEFKEVTPDVWQALQHLCKLDTVVFKKKDKGSKAVGAREAREQRFISNIVRDAAQHYVIPANRSLRLLFTTLYTLYPGHDEQQVSNSRRNAGMCAAVQQSLSTGCKLVSIKLSPFKVTQRRPVFGCMYGSDACWEVVVNPV